MVNLSFRHRFSLQGRKRQAFQYSPLDLTKREIRLLHLLPIGDPLSEASATGESAAPSENARIRCHLKHVNLDDRPSYTALSYAWGDSKRRVPLEIDGKVLYIAENLADAIAQIHSELKQSDEFVLWADAICINQSFEAEKCHQIQEMGDIYGKATQVIAWLGKADADSTYALESVAAICKSKNFCNYNEIYSIASLSESQDISQTEEIQQFRFERKMQNLLRDHDFAKVTQALRRVMQRKWWSRLWVIQEIALSKLALIKCGSASISWLDHQIFLDVLYWLKKCNNTHRMSRSLYSILNRCLIMSNCWRIIKAGKRPSLFTILEEIGCSVSLEVSDPRDKVYAVLGLPNDNEQLGIKPDYSLSCAKLYLQVTVALLQSQGLVVLSYAIPVGPPGQLRKDLSSWAVDFSILIRIPLRRLSKYHHKYDASGKTNHDFSFWLSESPLELRVKGVVFDTVSWKGRESQDGEHSERPHLLSQWLRELSKKCVLDPSNPENSSGCLSSGYVQEALWRTPVADHICTEASRAWESAKPKHRKGYEALLNPSSGYDKTLNGPSSILHSDDGDILNYYYSLDQCSRQRRMFMTSKSYIGLGSTRMQIDDKICILLGGDVPFILRKTKKGQYQFVGEAYVHGIMSGEFMATDPEVQTFTII